MSVERGGVWEGERERVMQSNELRVFKTRFYSVGKNFKKVSILKFRVVFSILSSFEFITKFWFW